MKNTSDSILDFLCLLARIRTVFRDIHLFAEKHPLFRRVTTTVNPFTTPNTSDYADCGTTIQFSVEGELLAPSNPEHKAFGASLLLRRSSGTWVLDAEIGWSGQEVGWDPIDCQERKESSIEALMVGMPEVGEWVCNRFKEEVVKLAK